VRSIKLKNVSDGLVEEYLDKFEKDKRYFIADEAIIKLFKSFPENKKIEDILLKISVINDLYSTNIFATFIMAEHIKNLNIDRCLNNGDEDIVNKIARLNISGKDKNFYSFATKYCNWHNREKFPIYDSFVGRMLIKYKEKDGFSDFKKEELRTYRNFKKVINDFRNFYKLDSFNFKEIDKFLWMYGKELFGNYRNK